MGDMLLVDGGIMSMEVQRITDTGKLLSHAPMRSMLASSFAIRPLQPGPVSVWLSWAAVRAPGCRHHAAKCLYMLVPAGVPVRWCGSRLPGHCIGCRWD